jgi:Zn-dependent protease with chaperone function
MEFSCLRVAVMVAAAALAGCGTTYDLPSPDASHTGIARQMFAEERSAAGHRAATGSAISRYRRVVERVEPVAEEFCRAETEGRAAFDCDVVIRVDGETPERNAFQTYRNGKPVVVFTLPLILDSRNQDELAFVLGHEFGHHVGRHVRKQAQQQAAGAMLAGLAMAYAQAGDTYTPASVQQENMRNAVAAGAAIGQQAYSQTYELEADVIATHIASAAGYDPVRGARFFARPEPIRSASGALSFWGTHPPDEKRLATVIATRAQIDAGGTIGAAAN